MEEDIWCVDIRMQESKPTFGVSIEPIPCPCRPLSQLYYSFEHPHVKNVRIHNYSSIISHGIKPSLLFFVPMACYQVQSCYTDGFKYIPLILSIQLFSMDSNYLLNLSSEYYLGKNDSNIIDLGLSLRVLQPEASCYSSPHENYDVLVDWNQLHPELKKTASFNTSKSKENLDDESEGIQSKQRWMYVKVNMDGVVVGRKVCILEHMDYFSLALQLEDMFGKQTMSGLRLFEAESRFSLFYKDNGDQWRMVGDVPWKEFVDRVKRLRIAYKDERASSPVSLT